MNDTATPVSETQKLADYLKGLGYPILSVTPETDDLTGSICVFDTNPDRVKGQVGQRLEIEVDFVPVKRRGKPEVVEIRCTLHGVRRGKNGRIARDVNFHVGNLMELETDPDLKVEIAQLVVEDLKLDRPEKVFDAKLLELESEVEYMRRDLREVEERLEKHRQERWSKEDSTK